MTYPNELKYTKDHEWAKIDETIVTVGITHHAQNALGDIVYVELPAVGRELKAHETFGVVESIKAVSDLYSPVAGKIVEINSAVVTEPALINQDPHEKGWMIKLQLAAPWSLPTLMEAEAYSQYVENLK